MRFVGEAEWRRRLSIRIDTSKLADIGVDPPMEEAKIDPAAMGRLAKALAFICGPDHPTTVALNTAADSGSDRDIKNARTLFLRLKPSDRRAALAMLTD